VSFVSILCVKEVLKLRNEIICGKDVLKNYQGQQRNEAIKLVIQQFGPSVEFLENSTGTLNVQVCLIFPS